MSEQTSANHRAAVLLRRVMAWPAERRLDVPRRLRPLVVARGPPLLVQGRQGHQPAPPGGMPFLPREDRPARDSCAAERRRAARGTGPAGAGVAAERGGA